MSRKYNANRRHHVPKMAFKVENWPEYGPDFAGAAA
jgi:hypothetical protein